MRSTTVRRLSRLVLAIVMAAVMPATARADSGCAEADSSPTVLTAPALRATTLCLLNAERGAAGLAPLRQNAKLTRAAWRHSRDMVAHRYFAHDSRSGATVQARVARTGWLRSRDDWALGENIAWGSGTLATPRSIVAAWMASPGHSENILHQRFHVIGIGVAEGVPVASGGSGATYTTDFGS